MFSHSLALINLIRKTFFSMSCYVSSNLMHAITDLHITAGRCYRFERTVHSESHMSIFFMFSDSHLYNVHRFIK